MARRTPPGLALLAPLLLTGCVDQGEKAAKQQGPPAVRSAECRRASGAIKLDGALDEPAWANAQVLADFAVTWQNRKPKTATRARLLWDDDSLYFAAEMDAFALAVRDGLPFRASAEDGLRDIEIIEAIYASIREGRSVDLRGRG